MPAIGTPPRFTEFSVWKPSTRLNSSCICAVVDHVTSWICCATSFPRCCWPRTNWICCAAYFPHACRACSNNNKNSEILNFRISELQNFRLSEKGGKFLFKRDFEILNSEILNSCCCCCTRVARHTCVLIVSLSKCRNADANVCASFANSANSLAVDASVSDGMSP